MLRDAQLFRLFPVLDSPAGHGLIAYNAPFPGQASVSRPMLFRCHKLPVNGCQYPGFGLICGNAIL